MKKSFNAYFMRGGTSKAIMLLQKDLPSDKSSWSNLFLSMMGSPDSYGRQLNGMGGGISSLSKVCIISNSTRDDADIDYTFAQVSVTDCHVDFSGNCGNMSSAVGPFAVLSKLIEFPQSTNNATVRIYNTNTQKIIHANFALSKRIPVFSGDLTIPGVSGSGAPISLEFINPEGTLGKGLLPTKNATDTLKLADGSYITVSMIDAAVSVVFVTESDLGIDASTLPVELDKNKILMAKLEEIRCLASIAMGASKDLNEAALRMATPKVAIIGKPSEYQSLSKENFSAQSHDIQVRMISAGQAHRAIPITGALSVAGGLTVGKSLLSLISNCKINKPNNAIRIGTPSGTIIVNANLDSNKNLHSVGILRTAKVLMSGKVYV